MRPAMQAGGQEPLMGQPVSIRLLALMETLDAHLVAQSPDMGEGLVPHLWEAPCPWVWGILP